MKRVVRQFDDLIKIWRITVDVSYSLEYDVAASIMPLRRADGSYDQVALAEYDEFIIEALEVFTAHDFVILEEAESPNSKSAYYSLVKKADVDNYNYKFVLFIRLSDHFNNRHTRSQKMQFYDDKAQQLKQPTSKKHQTWKLKEITVNGAIFDSYDAALREIDRRLSQYG